MALPFFTIGHSTRSIDEFVDLLSNAEVRLVVDVRTIPRSRTNPQYNSEALAEALSESRIDYDAYCCARRPARTQAGRAGGRERVLAESAVSQLRRLRHERGLPFRTDQAARIGARYAVRDHVRGGGVVAMPSTDHRRLSDRRRRDGIPHSRAQAPRAGTHDGRSQDRAGWHVDLFGRGLMARESCVNSAGRRNGSATIVRRALSGARALLPVWAIACRQAPARGLVQRRAGLAAAPAA